MAVSSFVITDVTARAGRARPFAGALLVASLWLACAGPAAAQTEIADPLESVNRKVFVFNDTLDQYVLEPVARGFRFVTPRFVRTGLRNFIDNLKTPVVLANDLFQAEPTRATQTIGRFMFNTIVGVGGLVDVGGLLGMPERHHEDFGQTLAVYGIGTGPYLMVPFIGPSNPRDLVGSAVDLVFDPLTFIAPSSVNYGRRGADIVSFREANIENFDEFRRSSLDLYAATRTLTEQLRSSEIRNGAPPDQDSIYDEDIYDLEDPAADAAN